MSVAVLPEQGLSFVANGEHVLHSEHVVPLPKCPALQVHTTQPDDCVNRASSCSLPSWVFKFYAELAAVQVLQEEQV